MPSLHADRLADLLGQRRLLSERAILELLERGSGAGRSFEEQVISEGVFSRRQLLEILENQYFCPSADLPAASPAPAALQLLPLALAQRFDLLPVDLHGEALRVAFADPDDGPHGSRPRAWPGARSCPSSRCAAISLAAGRTGTAARSPSSPRPRRPAPRRWRPRPCRAGSASPSPTSRAARPPSSSRLCSAPPPAGAPPTSTSSRPRRPSSCACAWTASCTRWPGCPASRRPASSRGSRSSPAWTSPSTDCPRTAASAPARGTASSTCA